MTQAQPRYTWQRNIWTGNAIHRVSKNTQLLRYGNKGPYRVVYWGDYSDRFPVVGGCESTPRKALKHLPSLVEGE